jgi:hypothetical protein
MKTAPMTITYAEFEAHVLGDGHRFFVGRLPGELYPDAAGLESSGTCTRATMWKTLPWMVAS